MRGCCSIAERYEIWKNKWDHYDLTYCFDRYPDDLSPESTRSVIKAALDTWAKVTCLTFTELAPHKKNVDIRIGWFSGDHGDRHTFDDESSTSTEAVLAHAFGPPPNDNAGKVHFNLA